MSEYAAQLKLHYVIPPNVIILPVLAKYLVFILTFAELLRQGFVLICFSAFVLFCVWI